LKQSFVSFVQIWQNSMQHITFDTYPKSRLLCPYLQQNPEIGILVMNNLQRDLIIESCFLPIKRFKMIDKAISATSIAATVWPGEFKMGIVPSNSFTSLGSQTKQGDKIIYIPRKAGTKRSVINEKEVLDLLRRYFGNKLHIYNPKNDWRVDRKVFEQASVIIGPHGGGMSNMIFAPVNTTIIEFLPLTSLRSKGENERPCYFGLARGLGFDYHSVEPLDFNFQQPMTVPLHELEKKLASIQPIRNDCALLFFGLAKHFNDIVLPSIQKYILDVNPDCDIYAHTYDIKEITNPRNNEKNSPVHPLEVFSMTKNVVLDTLDSVSKVRDFKYYRRFRQSKGVHPYSMDNMIKQWHSIDRVWRYANQEHDYKRYGLFRLDVRFAEPIDITNGDAVIASFHPDRGLNDRGFYGLYKWAKMWATKRFEQVEAQARRNHNDLNAESFMKYLMRDVPVELKSMCFNRVRATGKIKPDCKPSVPKTNVETKYIDKSNILMRTSSSLESLGSPAIGNSIQVRTSSSDNNLTLVIYSGPTTLNNQLYNDNFEYFLKHGLPSSRHGCNLGITVVVVLTNATLNHYAGLISKYNATCGEIQTMVREDRCLDMESARTVLATRTTFDKLVFLNCGLKGPFTTTQKSRYWTSEFTGRLTSDVKLTGITINCGGKLNVHHAHVQSMLWATDKVGLASIQRAGAIYDCGEQLSMKDGRSRLILKYELGLSRAVLKDGYAIQDLTNRTYHWTDAQASTCRDLWNDMNLYKQYSPSTLLFWKVSRGSQAKALAHSWV